MAGVTIRIEDAPLRAALASLAAKLGDMRDVMDEIGGRLVGLAKIGFARQQAPDGSAWRPLAAATILARAKRGKWPGPILRVSGSLLGSLNWKADPASVEIGAGWGESGPYAAIHQFGGKTRAHVIKAKSKKGLYWPGASHPVRQVNHPGSTIPARPYLPTSPLPDLYLRSCIDIINQRLGDIVNG